LRPGNVIVMDNLSTHKVAGVSEAIRAAGAGIFSLPSYSPELNPIKRVFAKLKVRLRRAGTRTKETLWTPIGLLIDQFRPAECRSYLTNSGHEVT
jgi:transposase